MVRADHGRWVAGVCAGVARRTGVPVAWLRAAFAFVTLTGGVGVLAYLACWIVIPTEGDETAGASRSVVLLAQACAGGVGLLTLGAVASVATLFGFGWIALMLAAASLVFALAGWPRVGPAWALLPVAALTLPSVAIGAAGLHLAPQTADRTVAPATAHALSRTTYTSGLGTLLVDLRHTSLPAAGVVPLRIDAGVRRTLVALPHDRCVHVTVDYHVVPVVARAATLVTGRQPPFGGVATFGQRVFGSWGVVDDPRVPTPGPTLRIDFHSQGGGLIVRDYPDAVDPSGQPDWPGYEFSPEPPPDVTGTPRAAARRLLRHWRVRHRAQVRSARQIRALMPGPCSGTGASA